MPKFICKCSKVINCSNIPNEHEYHLISDVKLDTYKEKISLFEFSLDTTIVLSCPSCSRLIVFWEGWDSKPQFFLLEK